MVDISIVNGIINQLITGGHHLVNRQPSHLRWFHGNVMGFFGLQLRITEKAFDNTLSEYLVAHPTNRKWVTTPIISGLTLLIPFITGVITHLLSGMSHQIEHVYLYIMCLSVVHPLYISCCIPVLGFHHLLHMCHGQRRQIFEGFQKWGYPKIIHFNYWDFGLKHVLFWVPLFKKAPKKMPLIMAHLVNSEDCI